MLDINLKKTYSRDLYMPWLQYLIDYGEAVDVRGRNTLEFLNGMSVVEEPWHHCILLPARRWNPWLALSEALWILAGSNCVSYLEPYNSHIRDYSDDGISLYGAYGARIYDQIDPLIERLRKDPSDRRAVLSIWDKSDLTVESKDPPCNNLVYFKLRNRRLHMTVICRSNDIHWGLFAVNLPTFGILQVYIASRLGVGIGTQTHLSNSLHVYVDDPRSKAITERMLFGTENKPTYPPHLEVFDQGDFGKHTIHSDVAEMCSNVLDGGKPDESYPKFLHFASAFLASYKEKDIKAIPHWTAYEDWVQAGKMFAAQVWK